MKIWPRNLDGSPHLKHPWIRKSSLFCGIPPMNAITRKRNDLVKWNLLRGLMTKLVDLYRILDPVAQKDVQNAYPSLFLTTTNVTHYVSIGESRLLPIAYENERRSLRNGCESLRDSNDCCGTEEIASLVWGNCEWDRNAKDCCAQG